jgi:hypothetical protein
MNKTMCNGCWWWESPGDFNDRMGTWRGDDVETTGKGYCHLNPSLDCKWSDDWCSHHLSRASVEKKIENQKSIEKLLDSFMGKGASDE